MSEPLETCTCWAVEGGESFCSCMCSYCEEYCLPPEPDFEDGDDMPDEDSCDHVNEREQAGGFMECVDCGRMTLA